ncbi:hypothetical protein Pcinc_043405 [Petrolisthes cinctipes]|uniref:Uncharacterized protein n=1 Tax=Petrolisthes cinctipes TaxID=88211 RepID=A0AAE1BG30_PETCI|nr:hypothetical protein Pcinc_043405 [Petrolisthes cinctipes]
MTEGTSGSTGTTASATSTGPTPTRPPPPLCPLIDEDEDYDAWVLAGGRLFRAHSSVLASHSAYLRGAAGGGAAAGGVRAAGGGGGGGGGDIRLLLPHVPSAGFAAVLTYMYTGRLPLTPSTLYEVLLAGHLLQMASVVSLCQALLTTAGDGAGLGMGEVPPALSMWRGLARLVPPHTYNTQAPHQTTSPATVIRPTPTRPRPLIHPALNPPPELPQESELMEVDNSVSLREERANLLHHHLNHHHHRTAANAASSLSFEGAGGGRGGGLSMTVGGPVAAGPGAVVLDVATCDGPVFFERVVNRAYKANPLLSHDDSETETEINVDEIDSCDDVRPPDNQELGGGGDLLRLRATVSEGNTATVTAPPQPMPSNQSSRTYHCVYCNHTFKSHYCYQKHMRRHINPITVEVDKLKTLQQEDNNTTGGGEGSISSSCSNSSNGSSNGAVKSGTVSPFRNRPSVSPGLRILDLNVQYFPCKTCGSKFPSYYFVHKHRRLCHQEEEAGCGGGGKKIPPTNGPTTPPQSQAIPSSSATTPTPSVEMSQHSSVASQFSETPTQQPAKTASPTHQTMTPTQHSPNLPTQPLETPTYQSSAHTEKSSAPTQHTSEPTTQQATASSTQSPLLQISLSSPSSSNQVSLVSSPQASCAPTTLSQPSPPTPQYALPHISQSSSLPHPSPPPACPQHTPSAPSHHSHPSEFPRHSPPSSSSSSSTIPHLSSTPALPPTDSPTSSPYSHHIPTTTPTSPHHSPPIVIPTTQPLVAAVTPST